MRTAKRTSAAIALTWAFFSSVGAYAQTAGSPAPAPSVPVPAPEFRGPDERLSDLNRLRDDVSRSDGGPSRSTKPVPVKPGDVIEGSDLRDTNGAIVGSIEKVGPDFAVVRSADGRIEVGFDSLSKNNKGIMINMPKSKFDKIVSKAQARK